MDINLPNKHLKVFGVPRTGTTFVSTMVSVNFEFGVHLNHYGNKHERPMSLQEMKEWIEEREWLKPTYLSVLENTIYPLIVIKNPYSWYQSILRFSNNNLLIVKSQYLNYNNKYNIWKKFLDNPHKPFGKGFIVRYEDMLIDPESVFNRISKKINIKMKNKNLISGGKFFVPNKVHQSDEFTEERRQFYLSDGNFDLSEEEINRINKSIDWDIMSFYGYSKLEV